jgi:hypothetical protein
MSIAAPTASTPSPTGARWLAGILVAFTLLGSFLYCGALSGPLVSDDYGYLANHPYLASISLEGLADIWNPWGQSRYFAANYAPVHLSATLIERLVFGTWLPGFHLVNVALHALNATLLVRLLAGNGLGRRASLLGGVFFLVHPANVEAVAWISQLKTNGALALALAALLARRSAPWLAAALFALALLTKATTVAVLPCAAALAWAAREERRSWLALAGWSLLFALYCVPELGAHEKTGLFQVAAYDDPLVHLRTIAAIFTRYLAMAATGTGVGAFQDPPPVRDALSAWWLAAWPAAAAIAWRCVASLRARSPEAAYWLFALAGFAPVSQITPFLFPIADRYLYFQLPGLIGGVALASRALLPPRATRAAAVALCALCVAFAGQSQKRARLWQSEEQLNAESIRNYPNGDAARWLRTCDAGRRGDRESVFRLLRETSDGGASRFQDLLTDPCFESLRGDPEFRAFALDAAGRWLETAYRVRAESQSMLLAMARAHRLRGEQRPARERIEDGIALGGPLTPQLRRERHKLVVEAQARRHERISKRAAERATGAGAPGPD